MKPEENHREERKEEYEGILVVVVVLVAAVDFLAAIERLQVVDAAVGSFLVGQNSTVVLNTFQNQPRHRGIPQPQEAEFDGDAQGSTGAVDFLPVVERFESGI